jgi:hypothetical protein
MYQLSLFGRYRQNVFNRSLNPTAAENLVCWASLFVAVLEKDGTVVVVTGSHGLISRGLLANPRWHYGNSWKAWRSGVQTVDKVCRLDNSGFLGLNGHPHTWFRNPDGVILQRRMDIFTEIEAISWVSDPSATVSRHHVELIGL